MSRFADQSYLKNEQYKNAANLEARMALHRDYSTNPYPWQRWAFDQMDLQPGMRVLEVGCGAGRLWLENLDRLPAALHLTLADFSIGMVQQTRQSLAGLTQVSYLNLDAQAIPFPEQRFDCVVANHMLYHVPDIGLAVSELHRVLRYGGRLFTATNGLGHMRELAELVLRFQSGDVSQWDSQIARRYSLELAPEILSEQFDMVEVRRFEDSLEVTRPEPLLAYIRSMITLQVDADQTQQIEAYLKQYLAEHSAFHVTKAGGMAIAIRS